MKQEAGNMHVEKESRGPLWTNIFFFVFLLTAGGVLSMVLPKKKVSEFEKRALTGMPKFNWHNLFEGIYTDSLDKYFSDNFPYRDNLVGFAGMLDERLGYRADDVKIYNFDRDRGKIEPVVRTETVKDTAGKTVKDSLPGDTSVIVNEMDTVRNDGEFVNSIFIYKGRGYQIFGGSTAAAGAYSNMINTYRKALDDSITIHCLVIPSAIDYYLPDKFKGKSSYEKPNIDLIYSGLSPGIVTVDAWSEINKHTDEYLYFHTDHHWTVRGAYYAYRAFCNANNITPYEEEQLTRKVKKKFIGSLYDLTRDSRLLENKDSVEYFLLPVSAKVKMYRNRNLKDPVKGSLIAEIASGANSYSVFLGGDYPLIKAETGVKNGKRILIIKDSFGNAISPFFALHYEEVYIIDYRYFETNILDLIRENRITDVLFLHNTFMANSKYTVKKELYLLRSKGPTPEPVKQDSVSKTETTK